MPGPSSGERGGAVFLSLRCSPAASRAAHRIQRAANHHKAWQTKTSDDIDRRLPTELDVRRRHPPGDDLVVLRVQQLERLVDAEQMPHSIGEVPIGSER